MKGGERLEPRCSSGSPSRLEAPRDPCAAPARCSSPPDPLQLREAPASPGWGWSRCQGLLTEEPRAGRGQRHQFWGEIRGGSAGNAHGEAAPREGHGQDIAPGRGNQPGEDKTALKRSQGTKPLSWAVLPLSLHGGRSGGPVQPPRVCHPSGHPSGSAPEIRSLPHVSRTSPSQPPSSPSIAGTLISTSSSAEAAFSCLLKINEADNDSAGAPGPDVFRCALGSGWRSANERLPAALSSLGAGLFVHNHS